MIVGAKRAGLSITEGADLLGLSHETTCRVYREQSEKRKHPMSDSSLGENAKGERRMATLLKPGKKEPGTLKTKIFLMLKYNYCCSP